MKPLALYFFGFSEKNHTALIRIFDLMAKKHDFEYQVVKGPEDADMGFFENTIPRDFPEGLTLPQIMISDGSTYCGCKENQHRITWGVLEAQIGLFINIIRHLTPKGVQ